MKRYLLTTACLGLSAIIPLSAQQSVPITTSGSISLPVSSSTATLPSLMSVVDRKTFAAKQNSLGYTAENVAMKNALNGYAGLDAAGKISWTRLTAIPLATSLTDGILPHANWVSFNAKQNALGFTPENIAKKNQPNGYAGLDAAGALPWVQLSGVPTASSTTMGCLKAADWITFNGKQNALGFVPENPASKNVANGYAGLDANGKIAWSRITGVPPIVTSLGYTPENVVSKGAAGGYASLNAAGVVPDSQLPSTPVQVLNETYRVPADQTAPFPVLFPLASTNVLPASVALYQNGLRKSSGIDFSVSGNVVTLSTSANPGDVLTFDYQHK